MHPVACLMCHSFDFVSTTSRGKYPIGFCKECGFMYMNPQPDEADLAKFYTSAYWQEYQEHLGLPTGEERFQREKEVGGLRFLYVQDQYIAPSRETRLALDIGCGTGGLLKHIQEIDSADNSWAAIGVELDEAVCTQVQQNANRPVYAGNFQYGIPKGMEDYKGKCDLIFLNDVLEHVLDPVVFLFNVRQMLSYLGILAVELPCRSTKQHIKSGKDWKHIKFEHLWYFHAHELESLLERCGYTVVGSRYPVEGRLAMYARRVW